MRFLFLLVFVLQNITWSMIALVNDYVSWSFLMMALAALGVLFVFRDIKGMKFGRHAA